VEEAGALELEAGAGGNLCQESLSTNNIVSNTILLVISDSWSKCRLGPNVGLNTISISVHALLIVFFACVLSFNFGAC